MQVILNEQGYVKAYALVGEFGTPSVAVNEPVDINDFENNYRSYYISDDNVLIKSEDKQKEIDNNRELTSLRSQRDKVCFPYINRGYMWYSRLTDEQKEELGTWYQAWLDVTETKIVPNKPEWLV